MYHLKYVTSVTSVHTYNTWSAARGALHTCNANYINRSFKYEGARHWTNLVTCIKFASPIAILKQMYLKDYWYVFYHDFIVFNKWF